MTMVEKHMAPPSRVFVDLTEYVEHLLRSIRLRIVHRAENAALQEFKAELDRNANYQRWEQRIISDAKTGKLPPPNSMDELILRSGRDSR